MVSLPWRDLAFWGRVLLGVELYAAEFTSLVGPHPLALHVLALLGPHLLSFHTCGVSSPHFFPGQGTGSGLLHVRNTRTWGRKLTI